MARNKEELAGIFPGIARLGPDMSANGLLRRFDPAAPGWAALMARAAESAAEALKGTGGVLVFDQIKEKFGTLRVYNHVEPKEEGGGFMPESSAALSEAQGFFDDAESLSGMFCMGCASPGTTGGSGWISTLCPDCRGGWDTVRELVPQKAVVREMSREQFRFFTLSESYGRYEYWQSKVANAEKKGEEAPQAGLYRAPEDVSQILVELSGMDKAGLTAPLGRGLTVMHYHHPLGFLKLCEQAGLLDTVPGYGAGRTPGMWALAAERQDVEAFWSGLELSRDVGAESCATPSKGPAAP